MFTEIRTCSTWLSIGPSTPRVGLLLRRSRSTVVIMQQGGLNTGVLSLGNMINCKTVLASPKVFTSLSKGVSWTGKDPPDDRVFQRQRSSCFRLHYGVDLSFTILILLIVILLLRDAPCICFSSVNTIPTTLWSSVSFRRCCAKYRAYLKRHQ